jgi:tetratricopeptide (TPR) repeat protein
MLSIALLPWAVFVLIFFFLYPYWVTALRISRYTYTATAFTEATQADCPAGWEGLFQAAIEEAESIGFTVQNYHWVKTGLVDDPLSWSVLLQNSTQDTHLLLLANWADMVTQQRIISTYYTVLADGTYLESTNLKKYRHFNPSPQVVTTVMEYAAIVELHQAHQQALNQSSPKPTPLIPGDFCSALTEWHLQELNRLVAINEIQWVTPQISYHQRLWTSIKFLWTIEGLIRRSSKRPQPMNAPQLPLDATIELEVMNFFRQKRLGELVSPRKFRFSVMVISFLVFVAIYALRLPSQLFLMFVGVLLFHEGGHILAMRICGYQALGVLFIPFLGALATARKDDASLAQKVWISLAGPLPGLILGITIALSQSPQGVDGLEDWLMHPTWLQQLSWVLIALNLFNLLPIYPLDGGQVVDLLLFSRSAYLGILFKVIGIILLFTIGLVNPLMIAFAIIIATTIPHSFKVARAQSRLKREFRSVDKADQTAFIRAVYTRFQQPPYQLWGFLQKFSVALALLDSRREVATKWFVRLGLFLVYGISLLGGLGGGLYAMMPDQRIWNQIIQNRQGRQANPAERQRRLERWIAQATMEIQKNPQDLAAYERRGSTYISMKNYDLAMLDANTIIQKSPQSPIGYRLRSSVYRVIGNNSKAEADRQKSIKLTWEPQLKTAEQQIKKSPKNPSGYVKRGEARMRLNNYSSAITDYSKALQLDPKNLEALSNRGHLYLMQKQHQLALQDANQILQINPNNPEGYNIRGGAYEGLGNQAQAKADDRKAEELYDRMENE